MVYSTIHGYALEMFWMAGVLLFIRHFQDSGYFLNHSFTLLVWLHFFKGQASLETACVFEMQQSPETGQHLNHLFFGEVIKINSSGKAQTRTCIITSEFLYTCKPGQYTHFRRRINLERVGRLLLVPATSDVLVSVPEEYDLDYVLRRILKSLYLYLK